MKPPDSRHSRHHDYQHMEEMVKEHEHYTSHPTSFSRPTDSSSGPELSRTDQGGPSRSPDPFAHTGTTGSTTTLSVPPSPPTAITVIHPTPSDSSLFSDGTGSSTPIINSLSLSTSSITQTTQLTQSTQVTPSTSTANDVSVTSSSGALSVTPPFISKRYLSPEVIAAAVIVPVVTIALIGAVAAWLLRRKRHGYAHPGSNARLIGVTEGAAGIKDKEMLFRSETRNTVATPSPAPTYAPQNQHAGARPESAQPMLAVSQQNLGSAVVDHAYFTGIDTTSEASIHGDEEREFRNSRGESLVGDAPPPYVRSLGSGRSAKSGSGRATTTRASVIEGATPNRQSMMDDAAVKEPETLRASPVSPCVDPVRETEESPFDDTNAADDDDTVSEISETHETRRDRMSDVSDLSYQPSLRSLRTNHGGTA